MFMKINHRFYREKEKWVLHLDFFQLSTDILSLISKNLYLEYFSCSSRNPMMNLNVGLNVAVKEVPKVETGMMELTWTKQKNKAAYVVL